MGEDLLNFLNKWRLSPIYYMTKREDLTIVICLPLCRNQNMKDQCGPSPFVSFFGTMLVIKLSIDCKSDN